jgi:hypothetical protein
MARRQIHSQWTTSNKGAALFVLGLVILLGSFSQAAWQRNDLFCAVVRLAFGALPSVILTAWQAVEAHVCAQRIFEGLLQIPGSLWPLFLNVAVAL